VPCVLLTKRMKDMWLMRMVALFFLQTRPMSSRFSLMMLHTDAFNKHNRNKITKADYVKNTRLPGVLPEVRGTWPKIFQHGE
jgi:hypothetical protein